MALHSLAKPKLRQRDFPKSGAVWNALQIVPTCWQRAMSALVRGVAKLARIFARQRQEVSLLLLLLLSLLSLLSLLLLPLLLV